MSFQLAEAGKPQPQRLICSHAQHVLQSGKVWLPLWIRKLEQRNKQGLGHPQAKDKNLLAPGPTLWYLVLVSGRKQAHRSDDNILVPEHVMSTCCVPGPAPRASCASINVISESRLCEAGTILSLVPAKPIKDGGRRRPLPPGPEGLSNSKLGSAEPNASY